MDEYQTKGLGNWAIRERLILKDAFSVDGNCSKGAMKKKNGSMGCRTPRERTNSYL
jgi:hypothetical protein